METRYVPTQVACRQVDTFVRTNYIPSFSNRINQKGSFNPVGQPVGRSVDCSESRSRSLVSGHEYFTTKSQKRSFVSLKNINSSLKSKMKSITKNVFRRVEVEDNIAKECSTPLMQLISLQSYDGSFTLNEALVPILGKTLKEMKAGIRLSHHSYLNFRFANYNNYVILASNKHNLTNQVFATALSLSFFVHSLADEEEKWELIVAKARKWLTKAVNPETVDAVVELASDFLKA